MIKPSFQHAHTQSPPSSQILQTLISVAIQSNVTIPADSASFEIPKFFTIIDDNLDESEQSFAIIAEILDVPVDITCFQTSPGTIPCYGTQGATEIRITDNDCKCIHFLSQCLCVNHVWCFIPLLDANVLHYLERKVTPVFWVPCMI